MYHINDHFAAFNHSYEDYFYFHISFLNKTMTPRETRYFPGKYNYLRLTINSSHYQQLFHRFLHWQFWLKPFLETKNHQKNRGLEQPGCEAGLRSSSGEMMKVPWFRGSRSLLRLNGELLRSFWKDNIINFSDSQFIFSFLKTILCSWNLYLWSL